MLRYDNGLELDVNIGGVELPDNVFSFGHLHLVSGAQFHLPMFELSFADESDVLRKSGVSLYDGTDVAITLGVSSSAKENYNFRLFTAKQQPVGNIVKYQINGYLDSPLFMGVSTTKAHRGTTAEVIQSIAEECGLTANVATTTDNQVWRQANMKNCDFVRYLALHGYVSEEALMGVAVRLDKELRYLDLNALEPSDRWMSYTNTDSNTIEIVDHQFLDLTAGRNFIRGYRASMVDQKVEESVVHKDTQINPRASRIGVNQDVQAQIERSRVEFSPSYSEGDVHDNWARARHQNLRGYALNSSTARALTTNQSGVDVFDSINIDSSFAARDGSDAAGGQNSREGQYIVTGKTIMLHGRNYAERINLIRGGINTESTQ